MSGDEVHSVELWVRSHPLGGTGGQQMTGACLEARVRSLLAGKEEKPCMDRVDRSVWGDSGYQCS